MIVEELMTRNIEACVPTDSCATAARTMLERDCGCVPVVSMHPGREIAGVVTDRDICLAACERGLGLEAIPVEAAMATDVVCCTPETPIEDAEALMRDAQVRRLVVVDDRGRLVGMISFADLARGVGAGQGLEPAEIADTIASLSEPRSLAVD